MKLRLEALSPAEGIGIVRTSNGSLRLIRPPYRLCDSPLLSEGTLREAIVHHGFSSSGKSFDSWPAVTQFLNQQVADTRQLLGIGMPEAIADADVLALAPSEVISSYLDRVEHELISHNLFDVAESILSTLLQTALSREDVEVASRVSRLLQLSQRSRKKRQVGMANVARHDGRFPTLCGEEGKRIAEAIRSRGSVLAFAAS